MSSLPAVRDDWSEGQPRRGSTFVFVALLVALIAIGLGLTVYPTLALLAAVAPGLLAVSWIARQPVRGFYVLIAATLVFEIFPLGFPDSLTDRVPFFLNLNNANSSAGLSGIPISPAEILMLALIVVWLFGRVSKRDVALVRGPVVSAYGIFVLVIVAGEIHGVFLSHGDWLKSLWEIRPQIYGFAAFLMATNLITERKQVRVLIGLGLLAIGFKVGVALYRFFITLHGSDTNYEAIMAHEESYFYALFIMATIAALIWGRNIRRPVMALLVVGSAAAFFAMVVNHRRAAELALIAGVAVIMALAIRFDDEHRGRWLGITVLTIVAVTVFTIGYWNHTTGLTGELVRPIRSMFVPDQRDYLSNIYRVAENANILVTFKTSPLVGTGFGLPMIVIFPMADISYIYPLWNYIPHDTLLWIGMRLGAIGWATFFGLIGIAILQACRQLATRKDPLLNALAAFAVAAIVAEIFQGYSDLQLDSDRNLIILGAILGLVNRLPMLADE